MIESWFLAARMSGTTRRLSQNYHAEVASGDLDDDEEGVKWSVG